MPAVHTGVRGAARRAHGLSSEIRSGPEGNARAVTVTICPGALPGAGSMLPGTGPAGVLTTTAAPVKRFMSLM
jgi:hypothetical protein